MKHARILIAVLIALLMVAPAALAQVKPQQPVPVPNVTGYKVGDAQQMLHKQGFKTALKMKPVEDSRQAAIVFEQNPRPGTTALPAQTTVTLTVGDYQVQPRVPGVTGMPLDKAQQAMASAGFNAVVTMENVTDKSKDNVVLRQQVPGGAMLAKGSRVPVVVGRYTAPATVPVPNATGMKADTAKAMLEKQGWTTHIEERPVGDSRQAGMVLQQVPPPGTQVQQKNQPVTLHVGKTLAQTRVPAVTGMPLDAAQKQLAAAKLTAVVSFEAATEQAKNNFVLKQQVAPGTELAPGAQVPLTVGKYTAPAALSVPSVTGKPLVEAQKLLAANKLNAVVNQEKVTDRSKDGIVLKQQVAPGSALAPGSQVPLIVGRYEAPSKVPNVVGMDWTEAKAHLKQAKLTTNIVSRSTSLKQKHNIVLEQSVRAGTEVAPGTKVDLVVGRYLTPAEMGWEIQNRLHQPIPPDGHAAK